MSNIIQKAKSIASAFTGELPVDEKWYKDRMEICNGCEFNTKNMDKESLSASDKLQLTIHACPEGDHCTLCKCCTHRKASQKVEQCGMAEKGLKPKWPSLLMASKIDKGIIVINNTPESGDLLSTAEGIIFDMGETDKERVDFEIVIKRKGGLDIKSTVAGCKCTVADVFKLDNESAKFKMAISTTSFVKGRDITRYLTIEHYTTQKKVEKLVITLKIKSK